MKNCADSKIRFGYGYELTTTGMAEKAATAHRLLKRKMDEYGALKAEIEALKSEVEKLGCQGMACLFTYFQWLDNKDRSCAKRLSY